MAAGRYDVRPGLLVHSDRGSQYCSEHYQSTLAKYGKVPSMSRGGNYWANAVAESTIGRIKTVLVQRRTCVDMDESRASVFEYVEVFFVQRASRHDLAVCAPASTSGRITPISAKTLSTFHRGISVRGFRKRSNTPAAWACSSMAESQYLSAI